MQNSIDKVQQERYEAWVTNELVPQMNCGESFASEPRNVTAEEMIEQKVARTPFYRGFEEGIKYRDAHIKAGDIVQITERSNKWFPSIIVVSEVKSFGVQGYVSIPMQGEAYIRLNKSDYEKVGEAKVVAE